MSVVDANEMPLGIDQRAATVAGIDWRVGLNVDHRIFRLELPRHRADHTHCHARLETERAAEGHDDLPGRSVSESPNGSVGRPSASTLMTARSVS
jgi:hypothetical protein